MNTRSMRVLLVEDNPHDALRIMRALENQPMCTLCAVEDGDQALAYLNGVYCDYQYPVTDLVLLDLKPPTTSSHELLAEVKSDPRLCHIPILVFSQSGVDDEVNTCYALDANCYIEKPRDPMRFAQVVQQAVDFWLYTALLPQ
jgi:two-component system, chemotaxis family, response regulator Rcp1